jgi:hypothetical protein
MVNFALLIFDFLKFLIITSIIAFVVFKIFSPLREKLVEKYDLTWIKSTLLINIVSIVALITFVYLYFVFLGFSLAVPQQTEIEYTMFEYLLMFGIAFIRILVASIILALALLFFEFLTSILISLQEKTKRGELTKQAIAIIISSAVFLFLVLFVFNWVPLGLFIYIFYGSVNNAPLLMLLII